MWSALKIMACVLQSTRKIAEYTLEKNTGAEVSFDAESQGTHPMKPCTRVHGCGHEEAKFADGVSLTSTV